MEEREKEGEKVKRVGEGDKTRTQPVEAMACKYIYMSICLSVYLG